MSMGLVPSGPVPMATAPIDPGGKPVATVSPMVDGGGKARRAGTSADRIVFLGHSTVLIELDGERLLTDPLLRDRVAHLRRRTSPVNRDVTDDPDAVLISHLHRDHLDLPSLRLLGRDTRLLAPAGAGAWLTRRGFTSVSELGVGEAASIGPLLVSAVAARHDGRRHPGGRRAQALGYLVGGTRRTVYFAGDTELFEGIAEPMPAPPSRLDVALLPVGGWGPTLGPGHMDPLDAARAACLLEPRIAIPIHWGTLRPIGAGAIARSRLDEPAKLFVRHVERLAPSVEVCVLAPGEAMTL